MTVGCESLVLPQITINRIPAIEIKYLGRTRGVYIMDKIREDNSALGYISKECLTTYKTNTYEKQQAIHEEKEADQEKHVNNIYLKLTTHLLLHEMLPNSVQYNHDIDSVIVFVRISQINHLLSTHIFINWIIF